jgi:hypothetical protein
MPMRQEARHWLINIFAATWWPGLPRGLRRGAAPSQTVVSVPLHQTLLNSLKRSPWHLREYAQG